LAYPVRCVWNSPARYVTIEIPEPNLSRGMQRLNQAYVQRFNRRHRRVGHVLQGRYKAIAVDAAYRRFVAECCAGW
jgi:hypothetical protein